MIGMSFLSFLTLTIIAAVVAAIFLWGLRYRFAEGIDAAFGALVVGWIGAWLGSPVFGHWLWKYENVYIIPAVLGAIATVHLRTLMLKTVAKLITTAARPAVEVQKPTPTKTTAAA